MRGKRSAALDYKKKDRRKKIRTVWQLAILLLVGMIVYQAVFDTKQYVQADTTQWQNQKGFIALSYFGVGRNGTPKLIAKELLDEHLKALRKQGYVTISQQDVLDFYQKNKPLPDKALFLAFEDGRNDSHLFAQPLLEKYNYKATALTYANKMGNSDNKFLQPKDLLRMQEKGFWEMGTNGYRLTYINIFDRDGTFIGVRDENQLPTKNHVEYYNHFLMDFIRDQDMIPVENRTQMEERITHDYQLMKDIYTEQLGSVPRVYMIMHANTLYQGMNRLVSDVNDANIRKLFAMHFNREGNVYNSRDESLYNLTRVQPAPYWSTNHLLMKIQKDTQQKMKFVLGDENQAKQWERMSGAEEFKDNRLILTSPPSENGQIYLRDSENYKDVGFTAKLEGNVVGKQAIYLRYDRKKNAFIRLTLENNELKLEEKKPGSAVKELSKTKLGEVQWKPEDLAYDKATVYSKAQTEAGAPKEDEGYPINIQQSRLLDITLRDNQLSVAVDKQLLIDKQQIDATMEKGGLALEAQYSKQNKKDDIYDAIFTDMSVFVPTNGEASDAILFKNSYSGWDEVVHVSEKAFHAAIDWVIETF
ncbi:MULTISPECIES: polysaccharide deacetylase family protein [Brevibacillus]|uniref:polysaccharide deacetylase family protein n=1 Tax=Brevibacillus TaxID=55080 RepID=UPI00156BA7F4|nr:MULTISPECIES: polysaccharide deacetylase family protein [Brevibacillus]MBU8714457.1 polysaccharide deacetylase [Brevibacillus parabrevis]UED67667.1 polysaccharide deacetylase family protein [Brevibacillus sp. HD3.3A]